MVSIGRVLRLPGLPLVFTGVLLCAPLAFASTTSGPSSAQFPAEACNDLALNATGTVVASLDENIPASALREHIKPDYPEIARQAGVEGYVVVQFDITREGNVADAHVIEAQPANFFETAALDAVKRYRFQPDSTTTDNITIRGAVNRFVFSLTQHPSSTVPAFIPPRGRTLFAAAP